MVRKVAIIWLFLGLFGALLPLSALAAAPTFNDPSFKNTWERVDKPVQDLGGTGRGYTWGPAAPGSEKVVSEPFNGGTRTVEYFDKARMEINNPGGDPNDLFYVTTGLLVKELVTGNRQDGYNTFSYVGSSSVQIAGDSNENGANSIAPTYASFKGVGTFTSTENGQPPATGSVIGSRIDKAGQVTTFTPPEQRLLKGYDTTTKHNIADVFADYGNIAGQIWNGQSYAQGAVFFGNPTYVLGLPITEPYWTRAVVAGTERDVLVQLFERRVLTYTPSNPDGFKVEMGNVGQHYFRWRYATPGKDLTRVWAAGRDLTGLYNSFGIAVDGQGNSFVVTENVNPIQKYDAAGKLVKEWNNPNNDSPSLLELDSKGNVYVNSSGNAQVTKYDNNGNLLGTIGTTGTGPGQYQVVTGMGFDPQDNLYVLDNRNFKITKFNSQGQFLSSIDLTTSLAKYKSNNGNQLGISIAVDRGGNIYLNGSYYLGQSTQKGVILKVDQQGKLLATFDDPNISPLLLALDSQGNLVAGDYEKVTKLDPNFKVLASWKIDYSPGWLAVDKQGNVYLVYAGTINQVRKYDGTGKLVLTFGSYGRGDGQLYSPLGLTTDDQGNVYVADTGNGRVQKFDPNGQFLLKFSSNGLNGIAVDSKGNIYATDMTQKTVQKFDAAGHFLEKWGGFPVDDNFQPLKIVIDGLDNIYIYGGDQQPILKYDSAGKLLALVGYDSSNRYIFHQPLAIAVDRVPGQAGKLYVVDSLGSVEPGKAIIREFDGSGNLIASLGTQNGGTGLNIANPMSMGVDKAGFIYIGDSPESIKKFSPDGNLLADWPSATFTPPQFRNLSTGNIAVDGQGNVYVLDYFSDFLLKLRQV